MRYLSIDLGEKRTGVAVGDDESGIASPIDVIVTSSADERVRRLGKLIEEHEPGALVLGLPMNMDGSVGPAAMKSQALAAQLTERFGLAVNLVDERQTSQRADEQMARTGLTRGQKKARRDALAAAVILQVFLDGDDEADVSGQ